MEIPELYIYIYRILLNVANHRRVVDSKTLFTAMRRVIRQAPAITLRKIISEMESYNMIKKLPKMNYLIIKNKTLNKKVNKLKPHVFPIDI
jgi:hypothetical protein